VARVLEPDSWLPLALQQASSAGLTVQTAISGEEVQHFADLPDPAGADLHRCSDNCGCRQSLLTCQDSASW
jgi:hypothetical protein